MLRIINMLPNIATGIPIGRLIEVTTKPIPMIVKASPDIIANNRPTILITMANKLHTATNGHNNNGHSILRFCDIISTYLKITQ